MKFGDYIRDASWRLCAIPPGSKSPVVKEWQRPENAITDDATADELSGAGLLHSVSGTACLDIDDFAAAADWAAMQGLDLQALWDDPLVVKISSGKPNRGPSIDFR